MQREHILETAPIFLVVVDDNLQIVYHNNTAGLTLGPGENRNLRELVDVTSVASFVELQHSLLPGAAPEHLLVTFLERNGSPKKIAGLVDRIVLPDGTALLRFTACHDARCGHWLEDLMSSEEVLRGFVQTSSEAMWCIEFSEPVDIGLDDHEIVRQVFENDCHWLLCNEALVQLYQLPGDLCIDCQPVSLYFPRSPENEAFILQIIHSDFAVDNAPSVDVRHDGSPLYMENNVRCSIVDGYLVRMWGTLRDVTEFRQTQNRLENEAETAYNILSALPDAILIIDRNRRLVAVNPSFETLFGLSCEKFLGRDVQNIIELEQALPGGHRGYGFDPQCWQTTVKTKFDANLCCEVQIAPIGEGAPHHFVLSLRPLTGRGMTYRKTVQ
jgi:PAS domain S-box-containing protein